MTDVSNGTGGFSDTDLGWLLGHASAPAPAPDFVDRVLAEAARHPQVIDRSRRVRPDGGSMARGALRGAIVAGAVAFAAAAAALTAVNGDLRRLPELPAMIFQAPARVSHPVSAAVRAPANVVTTSGLLPAASIAAPPPPDVIPETVQPKVSAEKPVEVAPAAKITRASATKESPRRSEHRLSVPALGHDPVPVRAAPAFTRTAVPEAKADPVQTERTALPADIRPAAEKTEQRTAAAPSIREIKPTTTSTPTAKVAAAAPAQIVAAPAPVAAQAETDRPNSAKEAISAKEKTTPTRQSNGDVAATRGKNLGRNLPARRLGGHLGRAR